MLAFSPDDRLITYLHSPEGGLVRQLYAYNIETRERSLLVSPPGEAASEENLSLEEKLRRERARQLELGVTAYAWAPRGTRLLVPFPDGLYVQDGPNEPLRKVVDAASGGIVIDPRFSPDGEWIAYVQDSELWVVPAQGGEPRPLTSGALESGRTHGLAEYIAQEEMDRSRGYWWSPDSRMLAFEEVDETHIPVYRILHQGESATGEGAQEDHRYPFAGQPNAKVRLGVVPVDGGSPVWMDLGPEEDIYLARAGWLPNGQPWAQIENREQSVLDLVRFDPTSGQASRVLREESPVWINLHNAFHPIREGSLAGGFIWASERTGFRHLYLYNAEGLLLRALTAGDWMVDDLCGVDETNGWAYFTATCESPLESHLYTVSLTSTAGVEAKPRRVTQEAGMHQVILDHACRTFIDIHNALDTAPNVTLRALANGANQVSIY